MARVATVLARIQNPLGMQPNGQGGYQTTSPTFLEPGLDPRNLTEVTIPDELTMQRLATSGAIRAGLVAFDPVAIDTDPIAVDTTLGFSDPNYRRVGSGATITVPVASADYAGMEYRFENFDGTSCTIAAAGGLAGTIALNTQGQIVGLTVAPNGVWIVSAPDSL